MKLTEDEIYEIFVRLGRDEQLEQLNASCFKLTQAIVQAEHDKTLAELYSGDCEGATPYYTEDIQAITKALVTCETILTKIRVAYDITEDSLQFLVGKRLESEQKEIKVKTDNEAEEVGELPF